MSKDLHLSILDCFPVKAQFITGEPVTIKAEVFNPAGTKVPAVFELTVTYLAETVKTVRETAELEPGVCAVPILLGSFTADFAGFGTDLKLYSMEALQDRRSGSFDVVSSWRRSPRYGFLSDFYPKDENDGEDVESLSKLHINLIQFYDWMYRHDDLVPHTPEFTDLMGRKVSLTAVKHKISFCHEHGMKAIAYGAVYAASRPFFESHRDWALYNSSGDVVDFIDIFKIMNISEECPWHDHIIGEYKKAVEQLDFDGIHMDTYGYPKTAFSVYGGKKERIRLDECFPALIDNTRRAFTQAGRDVCLIFNNVGNWPVEAVAKALQDAIYIEVWKPYERYHHIQQLIQRARELSGGKPVILAAYLKPFLEVSTEQAETSALLLSAAIAANGGYHMLLGEKEGILTQGYYVDHSKLRPSFFSIVRVYYDFLIRYLNVLFEAELKDVSMTHAEGDNLEYVIHNTDCSLYAEPGKVWAILRESKKYKTISLINLTGNDDFWNKKKESPAGVENIGLRIQLDGAVKAIFMASPDTNGGMPIKLDYEIEETARGRVACAVIPELKIWDLVVVEMEV